MELNSDIFAFDVASSVERLCHFINENRLALKRDGILVPLSGGLDSSTVLLLCIRAVGREYVTALLMPEMQGNPQALDYARLVLNGTGSKRSSEILPPF